MLIFILAVVSLAVKMPPKHPENVSKAANLILKSDNINGGSGLLNATSTDNEVCRSSSDECIYLGVFLLLSRIYLVRTVKQASLLFPGYVSIDFGPLLPLASQ
jgi:hypothetical protein